MKKIYFASSFLALLATSIPMMLYTFENPDNFIFWTNPTKSFELMFGTIGNAAFSIDLLIITATISIFMIVEGMRLKMKRIWIYVVAGYLLGFASPFLFFLAMRADKVRQPIGQ